MKFLWNEVASRTIDLLEHFDSFRDIHMERKLIETSHSAFNRHLIMLYCDVTNSRVKAPLTIQEHLNQMNTNNALSIQAVLSGFFLVRLPPSAATLSCRCLWHPRALRFKKECSLCFYFLNNTTFPRRNSATIKATINYNFIY